MIFIEVLFSRTCVETSRNSQVSGVIWKHLWPTDASRHFHTSWHWSWKLSLCAPCQTESWRQYLWWKKNHFRWWLQPWNQMIASWQESCVKLRQCVKKERHYSDNKGPYSQGYGLPSGHVWLWVLGHKQGRMPENWFLQTVVLEKTLESPLGSKEIKPVNLKGNLPEYLLKGLMLKLKLQYFGYLMQRAGSLEKSLMLGKIEGRRRRGC